MSILKKPYKARRNDTMFKYLKKCLNLMNMRDWNVDLEYGDLMPPRFKDEDDDAMAQVLYDHDTLTAYIWVSPARCKKSKTDPLSALLHEVAHIFPEIHNEELRCNILADLLWRMLDL